MVGTFRKLNMLSADIPPQGTLIALLAALLNPSNHDRHTSALAARDKALSESSSSYSALVINMARIFRCSTISELSEEEFARFEHTDPTSAMQLQHDPSSWTYLRCMAALLVKNALLRPPNLPRGDASFDLLKPPQTQFMALSKDYVEEIKSILLRCLVDPSDAQIRSITSSIIVSLSGSSESAILSVQLWPNLFPFLITCLKGSQYGDVGVKAALDTLVKFCEDSPSFLDSESCERPISQLVPIWISYLDLPEATYREKSLSCLNSLIETMPADLALHFDTYLQKLSGLAVDTDAKIRVLVCQAIVKLMTKRTEYVEPHFDSIVYFMLHAIKDNCPEVSLEACEFWLAFAAMDEADCTPDMAITVQNALPQLVPLLVSSMVYADEKKEELIEENKYDEADVEDRQTDIAPLFHKNRSCRGGSGAPSEDDGDEDDEDFNTNDDLQEWTLRKCAAASLDTLASVYGPAIILPHLLPTLQHGFNLNDPWVREASILALGAVAEGCEEAMSDHMPTLYPYLLQQLSTTSATEGVLPQVKSITCWTLSRYVSWMIDQAESGAQPEIIQHVCEITATLMLDRNKKVQVSACSALGTYIEHFADHIIPFLQPLLSTFIKAMYMYRARSFIVLCSTMSLMANVIGEPIGEGNLPQIYMPALLESWMRYEHHNRRLLLPLLECLACIALALQNSFQPWALLVFEKAMSTIEACIMSEALLASEVEHDEPLNEDSDIIVCSADLLDGMLEGMGPNFEKLVKSSARYADSFLPMIYNLCQSDTSGVRMSAFALVGDLARNAPCLIEPGISQLMQELVECIDPIHPSVCNNAVWAIGEIFAKCRRDQGLILKPFVHSLIEKLIPLLMGNQSGTSNSYTVTTPGIAENAAATMGRLARIDPSFVQADLPRFILGWFEGLAKIADKRERREAFEGLIFAILANPHAILAASNRVGVFSAFVFSIVSWHIPADESGMRQITSELLHGPYLFEPFPVEDAEIGDALRQLFNQIRVSLGFDFDFVANLPPNVQRLIADYYHCS